MSLGNYKVLLDCNRPTGWAAEIPSIPGCYALIPTRAEAVSKLEQVFPCLRLSKQLRGISFMRLGQTREVYKQKGDHADPLSWQKCFLSR